MTVDVHLVTPEREVWAGDAEMVIARGVAGEVGILGGHAPLLARLAIGPLRIVRDEGEIVAAVDGGFLHVGTDEGVTRADVLASHAELAGEIDVEGARRRAAELQEQIQQRDTGLAEAEIERARAELRKAMTRIQLGG